MFTPSLKQKTGLEKDPPLSVSYLLFHPQLDDLIGTGDGG